MKKRKLTNEEILDRLSFLSAINEEITIDVSEEYTYFAEEVTSYIDSLTDDDVSKLLLEVNIDLDKYVITTGERVYDDLLDIIKTNLGKKADRPFTLPNFKKLNIQFTQLNEVNSVNFYDNKFTVASYNFRSNTLTIPILNYNSELDNLSLRLFNQPFYKDVIVHELTHFDDYENIVYSYPGVFFNKNLQNINSSYNGILEVNAFSKQLIRALDKQLLYNFQNKILKNPNLNKDQLINTIRETITEIQNSNNVQNKVITNIYDNLTPENKKKVLKHIYLYFTQEFTHLYPFLKDK